MKTNRLFSSVAAFVVALFLLMLFGCGGGGSDGGGFVPTEVKISVPAEIPTVAKGQKTVTMLVSATVQTYGTAQSYVAKNDTTGKVLSTSSGKSDNVTPGKITGGFAVNVEFPVGETVISVYVNGATTPTTSVKIAVTCALGTAPDKATGDCN